jgi:uncharacterized protein (DUF1684 family)
MRIRSSSVLLLVSLLAVSVTSSSRSAAETESWRAQRERDLKSDTGWLTVAGLTFLKPGTNTVGSDRNSDVVLPSSAPRHAGELTREDRAVWFTPATGSGILLNGSPVDGRIQVKARDRLASGSVTFHVHESGERVGIRIRDVNSPLRRTFKGLRWFPVRDAWTIDARFEPYEQPRVTTVANVLGDFEQLTIPGEVVFGVGNQEVRMQAAQSGRRLWLIFSDATAPRETYRIRFLYADAPTADGRVTLDFNRAYNPPCAYNPYTTCPVPPPPNRLKVAIPAGERKYDGVH